MPKYDPKIEVTFAGKKVSYVISSVCEKCVKQAVERIINDYPPLGYSTTFTKPARDENGVFVARGSRYSSCD